MKRLAVLFIALLLQHDGYCCISCNQTVQAAIYDSTFYPNLLAMLSAFIVLALIVSLFSFLAFKRHQKLSFASGNSILSPVPMLSAATTLGIGMGGFIDGIVLHQLLQWHEMLSNKMPPVTLLFKTVNMFWDGIFHSFCLMVVFTGILLLWEAARRKEADCSGRLLASGLLMGWAIFNIVEGIIDHHLLKLHNVKEWSNHAEYWNFGFLLVSALMLAVGFILALKKKPASSLL